MWRLAISGCFLFWLFHPAPGLPDHLADDGDRASLLASLARTDHYLAHTHKTQVTLAGRDVPITRLRASLARFTTLVQTEWGTPAFDRDVKAEFEPVSMPGTDGHGTVRFTGYDLPLLEARHTPDARFRFPLYAPPQDLVNIRLGVFDPALAGKSVRARVDASKTTPVVEPYFSRPEIDDQAKLAGQGLELAWVDDEFLRYQLMVQGSGLLRFEDGQVENVNFAAQNGRHWVGLGKMLIRDGKVPAAGISIPAILAYFKAHPGEMHGYIERDPSYVFFKLADEGPYGCDGIALTPGRAIATDKRLFPSGAIAFMQYPRAKFAPDGHVTAWENGSRFVVDQDTGGAITGPGRVDIYWGGGDEAELRAGTLSGDGRLTYLLLKEAR